MRIVPISVILIASSMLFHNISAQTEATDDLNAMIESYIGNWDSTRNAVCDGENTKGTFYIRNGKAILDRYEFNSGDSTFRFADNIGKAHYFWQSAKPGKPYKISRDYWLIKLMEAAPNLFMLAKGLRGSDCHMLK